MIDMTHIPPGPSVTGASSAAARHGVPSTIAEQLAYRPATPGALTGKARHDLGDATYEALVARGRAIRAEKARGPVRELADRALFDSLAARARASMARRGDACTDLNAEQLAAWAWENAERHGRRPTALDIDAVLIDARAASPT